MLFNFYSHYWQEVVAGEVEMVWAMVDVFYSHYWQGVVGEMVRLMVYDKK